MDHFKQELVVIQDMLRVFIIRVACQKSGSCSVLLRPIFSWIHDHVYELPSPSDMDAYKASVLQLIYSWTNFGELCLSVFCLFSSDIFSFQVYRYLDFVASLLEHPRAKVLCFFFLLLFFVFLMLPHIFLILVYTFSGTIVKGGCHSNAN